MSAAGQFDAHRTPRRPATRGGLEATAVVLIAIGWPFAGVGTLIGLIALLASRLWSAREKLVGFVCALLPFVALSLGLTAASTVTTTSGSGLGTVTTTTGGESTLQHVVYLTLFIAGIAAPLVCAAWLWVRAGQRERAAR